MFEINLKREISNQQTPDSSDLKQAIALEIK